MSIRGELVDQGRTLVVRRTIDADIDDVWRSIAESERLSAWYGTWRSDTVPGVIVVTMTAEAEPVPPARYGVLECKAPEVLDLVLGEEDDAWRVILRLTPGDDAEGGTVVELRQVDVPQDMVASIGPGWEWYLDRLRAAVLGEATPTLADFERDFAASSAAYADLLRSDM